MRGLFQLLFQNGGFITFVLVESLCFFLVVNFNTKQGGVWDNTYGIVAGNMLEQRRKAMRYSELPHTVDSLMWENAALRAALMNRQTLSINLLDTAWTVKIDSLPGAKSFPSYSVIPAEVVSNSVSGSNNWVMLNRGSADGIVRNSGVIAREGIVGIIRHVDEHFSLAMSVLHQQTKISAILRGQLGSMVWTGGDPSMMLLNDIPKDIEPMVGDTVLTSGYSSMFPKKHIIGRVASVELPKGSNFYAIKVKLAQHPGRMEQVFVVNNLFANRIDSLQMQTKNE